MNDSVTELSVTPATARSVTAPGFVMTGADTARVAVSLTPPLVALIVTVPAATAVASPLAFTVATVMLLDTHVTVRPVRTVPLESLRVAANCCVAPATRLAFAGVTVTTPPEMFAVPSALSAIDQKAKADEPPL